MRFQVPQFIDVEDKIFGPLTLKQFIYLAGGASVLLVTTTMFGLFFGLLLASPVVLLAIALAFYKINNRPFIHALEAAFIYLTKDKLYIWKKTEEQRVETNNEQKYKGLSVPNLSNSKLKDMNWQLDTKRGEESKTGI